MHVASQLQNISITEFYSNRVMLFSKVQEADYIHCILHYISQFCKTKVLKLIKISVQSKVTVITVLRGDSKSMHSDHESVFISDNEEYEIAHVL